MLIKTIRKMIKKIEISEETLKIDKSLAVQLSDKIKTYLETMKDLSNPLHYPDDRINR